MIKFCFDTFVDNNTDHPWPNLVPCDTTDVTYWPDHLSTTPPFSEFPRIIEYLREWKRPYQCYPIESAPHDCFYIIDLYFFDCDIDFFALMSSAALVRLQRREIKMLIVYCEADSESRIQDRLFDLCDQYNINPVDIHTVMGHTVTPASPANFYYFDDDLMAYNSAQHREHVQFLSWHDRPRSRKTTVLSRVHKSWRAFFHAWFWNKGHAQDSYFSYCRVDYDEDTMNPDNNPLSRHVKFDPAWQQCVDRFLAASPFYADQLDNDQRNDYHYRVDYHHSDSYWNIVLETHMSLECNLPGVFLTEKTWKPIANAQPFVILGNAGSLDYLRSLGFRTFWEIGINEDYDTMKDPTERFDAVCQLVDMLCNCSFERLRDINRKARPIVEHNQQLFMSLPGNMLDKLVSELTGARLPRSS